MTFEEFWKENYEKEFGTSEPYYGIASYAFEKGQENCNCVYTDNSNVIQKLEKENEELKRNKKTVVHLADCFEEIMKEKLTKAKVALRKVVDYLGQFCSDYPDCVIEAEQFLEEVEK